MRKLAALACLLGLLSPAVWADSAIDHLLNAASPPQGVVFEIAESDDHALQWAIPAIQGYVRRLRQRYPAIEIAVVSHGAEEFALARTKAGSNAALHRGVQSLLQDDAVPLHVCGTYAGWYGLNPEDFPEYVDVAASGPVQLQQYEELGYERVRLEAPD